MKRGFTLIELMVAVALMGISVALAGNAVVSLRRQATEVAQREKALQLLEFEAVALSSRTGGDPSARARLLGELSDAMVDVQRKGEVAVITVSWDGPSGSRASRSLPVVASGRGK